LNLDPEPDIIELIMRACEAEGLNPDAARLIEARMRKDFGGMRVRIPKRKKHATEERRSNAYTDGLSGMPTEAIKEKHGISRATLYRLMKKGP
jgi:Mor family transcriptional regulator